LDDLLCHSRPSIIVEIDHGGFTLHRMRGAERLAISNCNLHCNLSGYRHAVRSPIGEESMPNNSNSEADAIQEAYNDRLGLLFGTLFTNLGDKSTEQQSIDRFRAGLSNLRKAKQLALAAVGAASTG
jgi:hypothetical protein